MPSVFERVLELLFPSKCLACGGPSEGKAVCSRCKEELRPVGGMPAHFAEGAEPFAGVKRAGIFYLKELFHSGIIQQAGLH